VDASPWHPGEDSAPNSSGIHTAVSEGRMRSAVEDTRTLPTPKWRREYSTTNLYINLNKYYFFNVIMKKINL
jgi:hypothetical protein